MLPLPPRLRATTKQRPSKAGRIADNAGTGRALARTPVAIRGLPRAAIPMTLDPMTRPRSASTATPTQEPNKMTTTVERVRVNDYVGPPIWGYRARCTCHNGNWRGPTRQVESKAARDAAEHNCAR